MKSVKEFLIYRNSIIKRINNNKYNLIITPRQWGLTTFFIKYINQIPNDKSILFGVNDTNTIRFYGDKITHTNCKIKRINETSLIGCKFDYIICDNFFDNEWIKKLVLISPTLATNGKIILGDTDKELGDDIHYFINYNKIIKKSVNNG